MRSYPIVGSALRPSFVKRRNFPIINKCWNPSNCFPRCWSDRRNHCATICIKSSEKSDDQWSSHLTCDDLCLTVGKFRSSDLTNSFQTRRRFVNWFSFKISIVKVHSCRMVQWNQCLPKTKMHQPKINHIVSCSHEVKTTTKSISVPATRMEETIVPQLLQKCGEHGFDLKKKNGFFSACAKRNFFPLRLTKLVCLVVARPLQRERAQAVKWSLEQLHWWQSCQEGRWTG